MCISWNKIIANCGFAFFSSLASTFTMDVFFNLGIELKVFLLFSSFNALIYGGLAFFSTMQTEVNKQDSISLDKKYSYRQIINNKFNFNDILYKNSFLIRYLNMGLPF